MANDTDNPSATLPFGQRAAIKLGGFIVNHAVSIVITLTFGSAATASIVSLHKKVDQAGKTATDALELVRDIEQSLKAHDNQHDNQKEVIPLLNSLEKNLGEVSRATGKIDDVALDVESLEDQVEGRSGAAKDHRKMLQETIQDHLESVQQIVEENIELRTERIEEKQTFYRDDIIDQIQALPEKLNSVHHAFIGMFDRLIRDGTLAIRDGRDGSFEDLNEWMLRANYVVRSLPIPSEDGIFLNHSLVEQDLRKSISEYEKTKDEDEKDKISHAERTLQIVKAVRDLAESGKIQ